MFVISTRIGGVPQANRDMMRAIADVYDCYALCCDRNVVEVLRATVTDYEVIDSYQLSDPITFATHVSREYDDIRSEEHTSELQSVMRISYAIFCLKTKTTRQNQTTQQQTNTTTTT